MVKSLCRILVLYLCPVVLYGSNLGDGTGVSTPPVDTDDPKPTDGVSDSHTSSSVSPKSGLPASDNPETLCSRTIPTVTNFTEQIREEVEKVDVLKRSLLCLASYSPWLRTSVEGELQCCMNWSDEVGDQTRTGVPLFYTADQGKAPNPRSCWDVLNLSEDTVFVHSSGDNAVCEDPKDGDSEAVLALSRLIESHIEVGFTLLSNISDCPTVERTAFCPQTLGLWADLRAMLQTQWLIFNVTRVHLKSGSVGSSPARTQHLAPQELEVTSFSPPITTLSTSEDILFEFWGRGFHAWDTIQCLFSLPGCFPEEPDEPVLIDAQILSDSQITCRLNSPPVSCHLSVILSADEGRVSLSPAYNTTAYAPPPRPTVRLSPEGYKLTLEFDRNVKDCYLPTCEDIFENVEILGQSPQCNWHNFSLLEILFGKGENLAIPGDRLTFNEGAVRAKGEKFWLPASGEYPIEPPETPYPVSAVITGPRDISACGWVRLSGERSEGGGGRPLRFHWTSQPTSKHNFTDDTPEIEINGTHLDPGRVYTFSLEVGNFLDSKDTASFQVVRRNDVIPMVTISSSLGVNQETTTCSEVTLTADVIMCSCSGNSEVLYEWSTSDPRIQMESEMINHPQYVIDKYTLPVGTEVTFQVAVRYKYNADLSTSSQITLKVARQALKVIIKGGHVRIVGRGTPNVLFDGSLSYDPDRSAGQLSYTWTCQQANGDPCYSVKDKLQGQIFPFGSAADGPKLVVCGKNFEAGRRYHIGLTVSKDGRTSTSTVDILVKEGNVPEVTLEPPPPTDINEISEFISLKAYVTSEIEFQVQWRIDDEFGKEISLSGARIQSMSTGKNNTYMSLFRMSKDGLVGGITYSVVVVATDVLNRSAETRVSCVFLSPRMSGCVLQVTQYNAFQMVNLRTSQCQVSSDSLPLTYEYRVHQDGGPGRRLSGKSNMPSVRVIGPAPDPGHHTVVFSVEVCSSDDVCQVFKSEPVVVSMVTEKLPEKTREEVFRQVLLLERKGDFPLALVNLATFLRTTQRVNNSDNAHDIDMLMGLVNKTITSRASRSALSVIVDQLDALQPGQLGSPKANLHVYTQIINWYEKNGASVPNEMYKKLSDRLELIKPDCLEAEYVSVSQSLIQTTAVGPMTAGQTTELADSRLANIRAIYAVLDNNFTSSPDQFAVTVDFGAELESRDWDCEADTNCNGAVVRFVQYNHTLDPVTVSDSSNYSRFSAIVDVQLRHPHTGKVLDVGGLSEPVVVTFPLRTQTQSEVTCRYWTGSVWSEAGLTTTRTNDSTVQCASSHLTAFALFGERLPVTPEVEVTGFSPQTTTLSTSEEILFEFRGRGFQTSATLQCVFSHKPDEAVLIDAQILSDSQLICSLHSPRVSCQLSVILSSNEGGVSLSPAYNATVYAPPPRPTARFSSEGYKLTLTFDRDVKDCYLPTCKDIFENADVLGQSSQCTWHTFSHLEVLFGKGDNLAMPGDRLTFKQGAVRAKGEKFWLPASGEYPIEPPVSPYPVSAVITGPRGISACGVVRLSGERSEGGGGRPLRYHWTSQPNVQDHFTDDTPEIEINGTFLDPGRVYTFSLEVENFLGSRDTAEFEVVRRTYDIPMVTISSSLGVAQKTTTCSEVTLMADVILSPCSGDSEVLYEWSTSDPRVPLKSEMVNHPQYVIDKYTLPVGTEVTFQMTVRYRQNPDLSASCQITLKVARQALKVIIKGGRERIVGRGTPNVLFDGSLSYDPDRSAGQLSYTWTCQQANGDPCHSVKDKLQGQIFPFGSAADGPKLVVCGKNFEAGRKYQIGLTVSKDGRTSTSTVDILVKDGNVPEVTIEPPAKPEMNEISDFISLKAYVRSAVSYGVEWLITDEFGKYIDLGDAREQSLTTEQNNTYISLMRINKDGLVRGITYTAVVVTTDILNRSAEARISAVFLSAQLSGCVLHIPHYTAFQMVNLRTSQCQVSSDSLPLTYEYRVHQDGGPGRRLSEKSNKPSVRVIGPAPDPDHHTVVFSVEVCSADDVCQTVNSDLVSVTMVSGNQMEKAREEVLQQVSVTDRKNDLVSSLVNLVTFLLTEREGRELGHDSGLVQRLVNKILTTSPSLSAIEVLVDQLVVFAPTNLGCNDIYRDYTQITKWHEQNGVSVSNEMYKKMSDRLELIKPGCLEAEYVSVSQSLIQTTAVGPMTAEQTTELADSRLANIRAIYTLLDNEFTSSADQFAVTVDFGAELKSRFRYWECEADTNCNGAIVRFVQYNQTLDPVTVSDSSNYSRFSAIVDIQLRHPHTGSRLEVENLPEPVLITFPLRAQTQSEVTCRYWTGSVWSEAGLTTTRTNDSTVQCASSHLTAFALFGDLLPAKNTGESLQAFGTPSVGVSRPQTSGALVGGVVGSLLSLIVIIAVLAITVRYTRLKAIKVGSSIDQMPISGADPDPVVNTKTA